MPGPLTLKLASSLLDLEAGRGFMIFSYTAVLTSLSEFQPSFILPHDNQKAC